MSMLNIKSNEENIPRLKKDNQITRSGLTVNFKGGSGDSKPFSDIKFPKNKSENISKPVSLLNSTLKEPITTAADDKFCNIFPNFQKE